jgi:hypothetical protein
MIGHVADLTGLAAVASAALPRLTRTPALKNSPLMICGKGGKTEETSR